MIADHREEMQDLPACYLGNPPTDPPASLKDYLTHLGLEALAAGDWRRVDLITMLIRSGGLTHE
jgi:hypothetical protein